MSAILGNVEILVQEDPSYILLLGLAAADLVVQAQYIDLCYNYFNLYDHQRQFYYSNFQVAGEAPLNTQVFNSPLVGNGQSGTSYSPQYVAQSSNVAAFNTSGAFSSVWWQDHANMYGSAPFTSGNTPTGAGGVGEPETLDKAATIADFDTYLDRYEEHRRDVYNERTWEWQNQSLNFGVKQASIVESGIATSFKFLDEASGNLADWFGVQSAGLAKKTAYVKAMQEGDNRLAAASKMGRGLAFSTNLGADVRASKSDSIFSSSFDKRNLRAEY